MMTYNVSLNLPMIVSYSFWCDPKQVKVPPEMLKELKAETIKLFERMEGGTVTWNQHS